MTTFYDRNGNPTAYVSDDGESVYLFSGEPVAWLSEDALYSYPGRYLGWIQDGCVYDKRGECAFFTDDASGGPVKPVRKVSPIRGVRRVRPVRGVREIRPVRPVRSLSWSTLSGPGFFG